VALILVLPLEVGRELQGVLAVGLGAQDSPAALRACLEPFAAVAAKGLWDDSLRARVATTEATLSALLESGSEMVLLLDGAGCIRQGSRAAREKLDFSIFEESPPRLEDIFPERERDAVVVWREAAMRGGQPGPLELKLHRGTILRLRLQATLLPEGRWQVGLEDLTAARSAERRRKEVDAELAAVLDSMESGMLLFDAQGGLRLANTRFAHLLGLEPRRLGEIADFEALLGTVRDRFREPRAVERRWREILNPGDEAAWDELEVSYPSRRVLERFARPVLNSDGERIGWLELYRDITGERLIQSKLLQAEKMAALGQLVSGIAHELNNPLTGIMGYAQLLLSRPLDGREAAEARRIFEEAERAGRIVKNLLLFAREKKPERKPVDLNEIIERTLALRSYELNVHNIAIERELDAELSPVLADAHQMQQVVLNLLVNAEQAIQQGRGRGRISVRTRRVSAMRMALEVSDDGPGIDPEIASRIFDPFFTTKPVGVGTGLGLSIVYGIVQEHGGEVTAETRPGEGTDFVIELPMLATERGAEAAVPARPRDSRAPAAAGGRKILVIEDEPTVAQLVVDVLREEGHQVEAMLDSVEALERMHRQHYDLVICDLRMPRLDGRDLYLSLVRRGSALRHRIIFITGDTLTPHTLEFLESNSLRYLAKPFLVEELKHAVELELAGSLFAPGRREGRARLILKPTSRDQTAARKGELPARKEEKGGPTLRGNDGPSRR
jgi:signal transduction histidine kinase/CheY-like chemotaxis protein